MQTAQKSSSSDTHQGILLSGNLKKWKTPAVQSKLNCHSCSFYFFVSSQFQKVRQNELMQGYSSNSNQLLRGRAADQRPTIDQLTSSGYSNYDHYSDQLIHMDRLGQFSQLLPADGYGARADRRADQLTSYTSDKHVARSSGYGSHGGGGYSGGSDCCPLVIDPLLLSTLLAFLAAATYLLQTLITMNIMMARRRREIQQSFTPPLLQG